MTAVSKAPASITKLLSRSANRAPDGLMSLFHGTRARYRKVIEAIGAEVIEIEDGRINEIRDYHLKNSLMSVAVADACGNFLTPSPSSMRRRVFWC